MHFPSSLHALLHSVSANYESSCGCECEGLESKVWCI